MATAKTIYFSGNQEVKNIHPIRTTSFLEIVKAYRSDSYSRIVGHPISGPDATMPVTRIIYYKKNPSLHKCDDRCMNATGQNCECSCGGTNHGINGGR